MIFDVTHIKDIFNNLLIKNHDCIEVHSKMINILYYNWLCPNVNLV